MKILVFSIIVVMCVALNVASGEKLKDESLGSEIERLEKALSQDEIELDIYFLPSNVATFKGLNAEELKNQFQYKLVIRNLRNNAMIGELLKNLKASRTRISNSIGDLRWGFVFKDKEGREISSFYADVRLNFGISGGGLKIAYGPSLRTWYKNYLKCCLIDYGNPDLFSGIVEEDGTKVQEKFPHDVEILLNKQIDNFIFTDGNLGDAVKKLNAIIKTKCGNIAEIQVTEEAKEIPLNIQLRKTIPIKGILSLLANATQTEVKVSENKIVFLKSKSK